MKEFLIQYFSSVFAGITLAVIGMSVYKKYYSGQSNKVKQSNSEGQNIQQNIQTQTNINVQLPKTSVDKVIETSKNDTDNNKIKY